MSQEEQTPAPETAAAAAQTAPPTLADATRVIPSTALPFTRQDLHQAINMLKTAGPGMLPLHLRPAFMETLRLQLQQQAASDKIGEAVKLFGLSEAKEGDGAFSMDVRECPNFVELSAYLAAAQLSQLTAQTFGPRLTLGQLAEQVRAPCVTATRSTLLTMLLDARQVKSRSTSKRRGRCPRRRQVRRVRLLRMCSRHRAHRYYPFPCMSNDLSF